jgi:hypothetical protein
VSNNIIIQLTLTDDDVELHFVSFSPHLTFFSNYTITDADVQHALILTPIKTHASYFIITYKYREGAPR